jgi:hypothetical protein
MYVCRWMRKQPWRVHLRTCVHVVRPLGAGHVKTYNRVAQLPHVTAAVVSFQSDGWTWKLFTRLLPRLQSSKNHSQSQAWRGVQRSGPRAVLSWTCDPPHYPLILPSHTDSTRSRPPCIRREQVIVKQTMSLLPSGFGVETWSNTICAATSASSEATCWQAPVSSSGSTRSRCWQ